jgi:mannose-6-phosphate isomerase-like protein (cupin superfamily)
MPKLESATLESAQVYRLPGRNWYYLIGPQNSQAKQMTFGVAEFPGGTAAAFHVHANEEEIVYIISGKGAVVTEDQVVETRPGVAVFIPPGVSHQIRADGPEPLWLVSVFSPPVIPGSYDPGEDKQKVG